MNELMQLIREFAREENDTNRAEILLRMAILEARKLNPAISDFQQLEKSVQAELSQAISTALQAKFEFVDGTVVPFFEGTYTILGGWANGQIVAALEAGGSQLYAEYDDKLARYVIAKYCLALELAKMGRRPVISTGDNQKVLQTVIGDVAHVYWGSNAVEMHGQFLFLGAGGCEISLKLLRGLFTEEFLKAFGYFGGLGDQLFLLKVIQALMGYESCARVTLAEIAGLLGIDVNNLDAAYLNSRLKAAS